MIQISRLIAALAYAGAAFLFGMGLGERGELGVVQHVFTAVIPLAAIVLALFAKQGRLHVFFTGAAMLAGLLLGQRQFERAWDECNGGAAFVRDTLVAYHRQHDGYPARLEELDITLPCRAGLRRTILHYLSNDRGFRLWYSNDRETIVLTATERSSARPGT
ncbi:MAG TPA: hypothetical protein VHK90_16970 [Thermoanaerobaculia bacterium]|nr:hypothetical protein [Thermoanaerobaculia bacterium]